MYLPPFSRRVTAPTGADAYSGDAALLYVMPTNMVNVTTENVVGVFQGISLEENPGEVTIDFFLNDPTPILPAAQGCWDGAQWQTGSFAAKAETWLVYDQTAALRVRSMLESQHQFTIPTGPNLIGISDDWVRVEDYKWIALRVAYATNPEADIYVQITPQTVPEGLK